MFGQIAKHFGTGLVAVLPFALVIWVLVSIFRTVDGLLGPFVDQISGVHVPGVGFVLVVLAITLAGSLARLYVSHRLYEFMDRLFTRIPFVKSLYTMIKDIITNFGGQKRGFSRAVLVNWPDERAQVIALVTQETLPSEVDPDGTKLAVFILNTFQFAGITAIVNRSQVMDCGLTVEEAIKFSLSAGLGQSNSVLPDSRD